MTSDFEIEATARWKMAQKSPNSFESRLRKFQVDTCAQTLTINKTLFLASTHSQKTVNFSEFMQNSENFLSTHKIFDI